MKIISKLDIIFVATYSTVIVLVGVLLFLITRKTAVFWFTCLACFVYLALILKKPLRRLRAAQKPFPAEWRGILRNKYPFYLGIGKDGQRRFEKNIQLFFSDFRIEGITGVFLEPEIRLLVAAGICTMIHGRPDWDLPIKDGIVVYPGERFDRNYEIGKGNIAGQASYRGPLIVTEESLKKSFSDPHDGYNVIFHELAHYFDLEDGTADGIPSLGLSARYLGEWKKLITREWKNVRQERSFLDLYAGVNEAEFFAVSSETFFEKPWIMAEQTPDLYALLRDFYNLDMIKIYQNVPQ
jgi:Mlc titration factor MtfA (ptsG expression regulator)